MREFSLKCSQFKSNEMELLKESFQIVLICLLLIMSKLADFTTLGLYKT